MVQRLEIEKISEDSPKIRFRTAQARPHD